jgi:hypothetical protein
MSLPQQHRDVKSFSHKEFSEVLDRLKNCLANLPSLLPSGDGPDSLYSFFLSFGLDSEILDKTGDEVATLGEQLKHIFGWKTQSSGDGIIQIRERGKAICALHPILKQYYKKYPSNNVLKKWVIDVIAGVEKAYEAHGVAVSYISNSRTSSSYL